MSEYEYKHKMMKMTRRLFAAVLCLLLGFALAGCGGEKPASLTDDAERAALETARICRESIENGVDMDEVLATLGAAGYAAVDEQGERGFVNADKLRAFAASMTEGKLAGMCYVRVCADGGVVYTVFYHADTWRCKSVRVSEADGDAGGEVTFTSDYALTDLRISDKGYLIYTCDIPGNTAPSKHDGYIVPTTMLRLDTRDESIAAYDKYVASIGYNANRLFTRSWSYDDLTGVNLNDAFLSLWRAEHGAYLYYFDNPYPALDGTSYSLVPKAEFETLVSKYISADETALVAASVYNAEHSAYPIEVTTAHRDDSVPIPEVTAVRENEDGTVTLTVDALFVERATDRAFTHLVTLKPRPDGSMVMTANERLYLPDDIEYDYESYFER